MLFFIVDATHAGTVTALVVDEDEAPGALSANVAKGIALTAEDVDVALVLVEMVKVAALKAGLSVLGGPFTGDLAYFGVD